MVYFLQEWDEKGILNIHFWKLYERDKVFCTNDEVGGTPGLILGRFFSLDVPRMAPVIAKQALYWMDSIFAWKELLKAWS